MTAQRRRPATASIAADPDALSRDELRRLAKAERKLASPDRVQSVAGQREIDDLERRHAERLASQSLAARLAETAALARRRGEDVRAESLRLATPLVDEHGARIVRQGLPLYRQETLTRVRISSRSGLQLAFERGDLDGGPVRAEHLLDIGKIYRRAFETGSALTTPQRTLEPISSASPLRASAGPQDAVFAAGEILRVLRADLSPSQIAILDRVCGLDLTLAAVAAELKADARTIRRLLLEALTRAADNRRAEKAA